MQRNFPTDIRPDIENIFGTPRPSQSAVQRWRMSWRDTGGHVRASSFADATRKLAAQDINPIFWQTKVDEQGQCWVVFWNPEDEVLFKMHS